MTSALNIAYYFFCAKAKQDAIHYAKNFRVKFILFLSSLAHLEDPQTLKDLIKTDKRWVKQEKQEEEQKVQDVVSYNLSDFSSVKYSSYHGDNPDSTNQFALQSNLIIEANK